MSAASGGGGGEGVCVEPQGMPEKLPVLLVADDDRSLCNMLSLLFDGVFRVVIAQSGLTALRAVEEHCPDVALVDLLLPDVHGVDLLEPMHECDPSLPVIFLSGVAVPAVADEALRRGAFDYVVKPVDDFEALERLLLRAAQTRMRNPSL